MPSYFWTQIGAQQMAKSILNDIIFSVKRVVDNLFYKLGPSVLLEISQKVNIVLKEFCPLTHFRQACFEASAKIHQKKGSLFERFDDTKI